MIGHPRSGFVPAGIPDGGEVVIAVVVVGVVLVAVLIMATVLADSLTQARVAAAAKQAAADAAREASPDRAMAAAQRAAADTLTDVDRFGRPLIVVDVSRFRTAGLVEVTIACTVAPRPIGPIERALQLRQATASASIHSVNPAR